jgi:hypothetical protein
MKALKKTTIRSYSPTSFSHILPSSESLASPQEKENGYTVILKKPEEENIK